MKPFSQAIIFGLVLGMLFSFGIAVAAVFQSPKFPPPEGNVPAPLNVGPSSQTKTGGILTVQDFWVNNAMGVTGGVSIGGNLAKINNIPYSWPSAPGAAGTVLTNSGAAGTLSWGTVAGSGLWTASGTNISNTNTGNVGIGTTGPGGKLGIQHGWGNWIQFDDAVAGNKYMFHNPQGGDRFEVGVYDAASATQRWGVFTIKPSGNVGIGTTDPGTDKLRVAGNASITGSLTANKLTVNTIDPVYEIGGKKYATYVADVAGGVKTEVTGKFEIRNSKFEIDFDEQKTGSNLWLFWQTSNKNVNDIAVLLTPAFDGKAWYEKNRVKNQIIIKSDQNGEVSFRLTAPRKDAAQWPNEIKD